MINFLFALGGAVLLAMLLYFESRQDRWGYLVAKSTLSLCFVGAALIQPHRDLLYANLIVTGLVCCLAGDVLLALWFPRALLAGLFAFLAGHVIYILAFGHLTPWSNWLHPGVPFVAAAGLAAFIFLKPRLGRMSKPVMVYLTVVSLMLIGALAAGVSPTLPPQGGVLVAVGGFFFYFSDYFVARQRFVKRESLNRYVGLPLYFIGQFLLAFSTGVI